MKKENKTLMIAIILAVIFIAVLILSLRYYFLSDMFNKEQIFKQYCKDNNFSPCQYPFVQCFNDCRKLNQIYLIAKTSGFGHSEECWCLNNGGSNRIW